VIAAAVLLDVNVAPRALLCPLSEPLKGLLRELKVVHARSVVRWLLAANTKAVVARGTLAVVPPKTDQDWVAARLHRAPHHIRHGINGPVEKNRVVPSSQSPIKEAHDHRWLDLAVSACGVGALEGLQGAFSDVDGEEALKAVATVAVTFVANGEELRGRHLGKTDLAMIRHNSSSGGSGRRNG